MTGLLLTDKKLRAKELFRKPKETLLEAIDLERLHVVKRWGPFQDLMVNAKRFLRFDGLIDE